MTSAVTSDGAAQARGERASEAAVSTTYRRAEPRCIDLRRRRCIEQISPSASSPHRLSSSSTLPAPQSYIRTARDPFPLHWKLHSYRASALPSAVIRMNLTVCPSVRLSVSLSVCLSRCGIISKETNLLSSGFHHLQWRLWGNFDKNLNCHNSGCMQDRVVIFDSRVGFSGTAYLTASFKFTPGLSLLPWQRNLGQNRL